MFYRYVVNKIYIALATLMCISQKILINSLIKIAISHGYSRPFYSSFQYYCCINYKYFLKNPLVIKIISSLKLTAFRLTYSANSHIKLIILVFRITLCQLQHEKYATKIWILIGKLQTHLKPSTSFF